MYNSNVDGTSVSYLLVLALKCVLNNIPGMTACRQLREWARALMNRMTYTMRSIDLQGGMLSNTISNPPKTTSTNCGQLIVSCLLLDLKRDRLPQGAHIPLQMGMQICRQKGEEHEVAQRCWQSEHDDGDAAVAVPVAGVAVQGGESAVGAEQDS